MAGSFMHPCRLDDNEHDPQQSALDPGNVGVVGMSAGAREDLQDADGEGKAGGEPLAPWAFRAAMSGLSEEQARELLEGERCPQPSHEEGWEAEMDALELREEGSEVVVYRTDEEHAWLQSDTTLRPDEVR
jgi:hypothetical protein